jgi:hypothetical protein
MIKDSLAISPLYSRVIDVAWMLVLALVAAEYALHYNIFLQAIPHDTTYHIYAAQQMLDGHAIYRDVAIIKAPLSDFATALALVVGRALGISDIMSARLMSLLTFMGTASVTYWAGRVLFKSRAVGLIAGLIMAGWDFYGLRAVTGPEPKAFLILFAMPAFVFLAQKRWTLAGACGALATLAWQPALMVPALALAGALVAPWLESKRDAATRAWRVALRQALRVVVGFAIPFAFVILYLGWNDALLPAWHATIGANIVHFNNEQAKTPLAQIISDNYVEIFYTDAKYCFSPLENWLVLASGIGFAGIVLAQIVTAARAKRAPINLERTPFLLYGLGFIAFSLIDFDFCPDLFPLLPIMALSVGWLVWSLARGAGALAEKYLGPARARYVPLGIVLAAIALIVDVYLFDVNAYTIRGPNFQDQQYAVNAARKYLAPGDTVLSFGDAMVLVELHLSNASKIVHLGSKSGLGVLAFEPGGFQGMVDDLDRNPPKLITLARETHLDWQQPFYDWLQEFYEPADVFPRANMRFFIRKP